MSLDGFLQMHFPTLRSALRIVKNGRFELLPPRITYANGALHKRLLKYLNFKDGFFFEIGANNGLDQSNTAYLEKYLGWSGILVEAMPHKFVECAMNRPKANVVHAALGSHSGPNEFVRIHYSNLMSVASLPNIALEATEHIEKGRGHLGMDRILSGQEFLAPLKTVTEVLDTYNAPRIDFFSLDVEGGELEVLNGLDFSRHRPKLFLIEVRDLDQMSRFMAERGYTQIDQLSFHDYLFRDTRG